MNTLSGSVRPLVIAALLAASFGAAADTATSDADKKSGFSALPGAAAAQLAPSDLDKVHGQFWIQKTIRVYCKIPPPILQPVKFRPLF